MLDEPTANLDIEHTLEVLELSKMLAAKGKAVVLASHDLNLVAAYLTQMVWLQSGIVVEWAIRKRLWSLKFCKKSSASAQT